MNPFSIAAMVLAIAIMAFFWVRKLPMTMGIVFANIVVFVISTVTSERLTTSIGSPLIDDLAFRQQMLVMRSESDRLRKLLEFFPTWRARQIYGQRLKEIAPRNGHARLPDSD